jgi:hypothetical protein
MNAKKSIGRTAKTAQLAATTRKPRVQAKAAAEHKPEPLTPRAYDGSAAQARITTMLDEVRIKNDDLEQRANRLLGRLG